MFEVEFPALHDLPAPLQTLADRLPVLRLPIRFGLRFVARWNRDSCPLMAGALAFFGLLSVFPLLLAGVTVVSRLLANNVEALQDFSEFVSSFFPGSAGDGLDAELERAVRSIASAPSISPASVFAFLSLLWSGRAYFDTLATVLNQIFPSATPRSFWSHQLTLWSLLFGAGALFVLSTSITFSLSGLQALAAQQPNLFFSRAPQLWSALGRLASMAVSFSMFYVLYRFTPNRSNPPKRRLVMFAALVGTLGWEVGKWAFTRFLGNVSHYQVMYGSVAGIVVTMLWMYYASSIVLLGAECGAVSEEMRMEKAHAKNLALGMEGRTVEGAAS